MPKLKLTREAVTYDCVPRPDGPSNNTHYWDEDLTGFGVMVSSSGRRTYVYHRSLYVTLGDDQVLTFGEASKIAKAMRGVVDDFLTMAKDRSHATRSENRRQLGALKAHPIHLTTSQSAALLNVPKYRMEAWRAGGGGPKWTRMGDAIRYRREDLDSYVEGGK